MKTNNWLKISRIKREEKKTARRAFRIVGICFLAVICAIPALADSTNLQLL